MNIISMERDMVYKDLIIITPVVFNTLLQLLMMAQYIHTYLLFCLAIYTKRTVGNLAFMFLIRNVFKNGKVRNG